MAMLLSYQTVMKVYDYQIIIIFVFQWRKARQIKFSLTTTYKIQRKIIQYSKAIVFMCTKCN